MKRIKRSLTLMEIFIYFALCSSIVAILLSSLKNHLEINFKLNHAKTDIMQRERIQQRLGSIFFSLSLPPKQNPFETKDNLIYLETINNRPYLHFYFNNKIDPDPAFCKKVKALLTLSETGTMYLSLRSLENNQERIETLLSGIDKLELKFLFQDNRGTFIEIDTFKNHAPSSLKAIKLFVFKQAKKPQEFIFWLPFKINPIEYSDAI